MEFNRAMSTTIPIYQVDAFSSAPFSGNPAAVALLDNDLPDTVRQNIAAEMNLAETAFVERLPEDDEQSGPFESGSCFRLRWFTPTTEVPMCGHATLASAAVLFQEMKNPSSTLFFRTHSGVLSVRKRESQDSAGSSNALQMQMGLPIAAVEDPLPPCLQSEQGKAAFAKACVGDLQVEEWAFSRTNALNYVLLKLPGTVTKQQLEQVVPDTAAMTSAAPKDQISGAIITCEGGDARYDFVSRFFGPWMGIPEDPVTGSAHTVLGPFWTRRLQGKGSQPGKVGPNAGRIMDVSTPITSLKARQCSPRGGDLEIQVHDSRGEVLVSGPAVVVLRGQLQI